MVIAIDGPSGAGKGTVARAVARALGFRHVDTGAMYRAVAWRALQSGVPLDDEARLAQIAESARLELGDQRILLDDEDVTERIRTPEIDRAAAAVARQPLVRRALVERQQQMRPGPGGGLVMEGRDIGTVVFPDADLKIFLDASPEERARRRARDPAHGSRALDLETVASEIAARDHADATRLASPLAVAADAVVIDTTGVPVSEVVARVLELARQVAAAPQARSTGDSR